MKYLIATLPGDLGPIPEALASVLPDPTQSLAPKNCGSIQKSTKIALTFDR
jgi:hypothetical protein